MFEPGQSRADAVAQEMLARLLDGGLAAERRLPPEPTLAEMFGVSRLTVREAVKLMAARGVLEVRQGSGTTVRPIEDWTLLDPYVLLARARYDEDAALELARNFLEARRTIESSVARLATPRIDEATLAALADDLDQMREASDGTPDVSSFVDADIEFHHRIMQSARNAFLGVMFDPFADILHLTRTQTSVHAPIRAHAIRDHQKILDALRSGDPRLAEEAMNEHLLQTERDVDTYVGGPLALLLTADPVGGRTQRRRRSR